MTHWLCFMNQPGHGGTAFLTKRRDYIPNPSPVKSKIQQEFNSTANLKDIMAIADEPLGHLLASLDDYPLKEEGDSGGGGTRAHLIPRIRSLHRRAEHFAEVRRGRLVPRILCPWGGRWSTPGGG